jgi:hypothetical protein
MEFDERDVFSAHAMQHRRIKLAEPLASQFAIR